MPVWGVRYLPEQAFFLIWPERSVEGGGAVGALRRNVPTERSEALEGGY